MCGWITAINLRRSNLLIKTDFSISAVDLDLSQDNVQDAFVIAVEQQARERLERLSALRKITPIDITKLSEQVCAIDIFKLLVLISFIIIRYYFHDQVVI